MPIIFVKLTETNKPGPEIYNETKRTETKLTSVEVPSVETTIPLCRGKMNINQHGSGKVGILGYLLQGFLNDSLNYTYLGVLSKKEYLSVAQEYYFSKTMVILAHGHI